MMLVIRNAAQVVTGVPRRGDVKGRLEVMPNAALVCHESRVGWIGPTADVPPLLADAQVIDAAGKVVIPGLIDSHTHLVFAGSREDEFEQRLRERGLLTTRLPVATAFHSPLVAQASAPFREFVEMANRRTPS